MPAAEHSNDFSRPASVALPGSRIRRARSETSRVRPASAGPSEARTQEGRIADALFGRPRTQPRAASAAARCVREVSERALKSSAGGSQRRGASPGPVVRAARGCSTSSASNATAFRTPLTVSASTPATSNRGAVTSAAGRGAQPKGQASPEGLTATAAHTVPLSVASGKAQPADVTASFAVNAPHSTGPTRMSDCLSSLHSELHSAVAVSAHDPSPRASLASAGPSAARTQPAWRGSATRAGEDAATRSVPAAARGGGGGGSGRFLTGHFPPISAHRPCTTAVPTTQCLKPIGCAPNSSGADRTQSAHNRKD
jgi:hypothetical protein